MYSRESAQTSLDRIREIAIENAREGITIADARQPGCPLIFVNRGFTLTTGYEADEVIGKNCRFLQGPETCHDEVDKMRKAIASHTACQHDLLNYRKDGTPFWNRLSITPICDVSGVVSHFVGIQEDISARREKELLEANVARQQLIAETTLVAAEKRSNEIGAELHDNVNQMLALCMMYTNLAIREQDEIRKAELIHKNKALLADAIKEIRRLSHMLVGPKPSDSFQPELQNLIAAVGEGSSLHIELGFSAAAERLPQEKKLTFYRVLQEQLNNIVRHAHAQHVCVSLDVAGSKALLIVEDDGIGIKHDSIQTAGVGIQNMRNRLEKFGGTLSISEGQSGGCLLRAEIPADAAPLSTDLRA